MNIKRKIIKIDEEKCDGCGLCIPNCPEGALQVIDGKARLISDLLCDGLGACIGECPKGAIEVEEREAGKYDERKVMENMMKKGKNTIKAHLSHLKDHGQAEFLKQAVDFLKEKGVADPLAEGGHRSQVTTHKPEKTGNGGEVSPCGCPGAREMSFDGAEGEEAGPVKVMSRLRQWPVQLQLVSPLAPYFKKADVLLAADCVAYAYGNFHNEFLKGKALAIACPKLDENQESYLEKIKSLIEDAGINTLTVLTMEVPCCMGLLNLVKLALRNCARKAPVKHVIIGLQGAIKHEEWLSD